MQQSEDRGDRPRLVFAGRNAQTAWERVIKFESRVTRLPRTSLPCKLEGGSRAVRERGFKKMEPPDPGGGKRDDKKKDETLNKN